MADKNVCPTTKDGKSMRRPVFTWRILLAAVVLATGCAPTQPFYLHEDGDLSHYIDKATAVSHPDLQSVSLEDVAQAQRPLSVLRPDFKEFWDLSLEECVAIALLNTKVVRGGTAARLQNGQIFAGTQEGALVLNAIGRFVTAYDPAVVESNPGQQVGGLSNFLTNQTVNGGGAFNGPTTDGGIANVRQGVEAALSQFDAQLNVTSDPSNGIMSTTDRPQNVRSTSPFFPTILNLHNGGMDVALSKRTAEGTLFTVTSSTDYNEGNTRGFNFVNPAAGTQPFLHTWTQVMQVEARHPLLRGRGSQINRMPIILARIGTDIELLNVYANVQDMLNNIEIRYWDLYLAYRNLETAKVGRDSALVTWRIVFDKFEHGTEPVMAEAQAQEQYYNFRGSVEAALRTLYDTENELRFLMGLAATDGRLVRPKDDPTLARVEFDWNEILVEAVARRPELVNKRWQVKQRELELILARNLLLPQFDVGAQYRWFGIGQDLINAGRGAPPVPGVQIDPSAFQSLTGGQFQEFSVLFQYQMPIGFRRELAAVRHAQLRLAREKATLEDMELDVSHGLAHALRNLETNFQLSQTNSNRWAASQREVEAREALYAGGRVALDDVLDAQRRRAVAQGAFWSAVIEYNKSIADLHTRKGSIMDYDGIGFEEGPWPQKAYWDALYRARERDAGLYVDYGWTRPKVISRGPIPQRIPVGAPQEGGAPLAPEELPAGEPTPAAEPTPAQPPASEGTETSPLPPPTRVVPQETRLEPLPVTPRSTSTKPGSKPIGGDGQSLPFGLRFKKPQQQVMQANWAEAADSSGNPLRGNRPVGTGVAEAVER
jgi:outer membrane protein TolC